MLFRVHSNSAIKDWIIANTVITSVELLEMPGSTGTHQPLSVCRGQQATIFMLWPTGGGPADKHNGVYLQDPRAWRPQQLHNSH